MNEENLFAFPGSRVDENSQNPFDLGTFTECTGEDPENPFLGMFSDEKVKETAPQSDAAQDAPTAKVPRNDPEQTSKAAEQEFSETPASKASEAPRSQTLPPAEDGSDKKAPGEELEENPLLAAMNRQEERNALRAAEPIFAQLPIFSYNGTEEPIENLDQTFEELRLSKADDFPEFDEAQSLRWTVAYGKISKSVSTPRKTKIGQFKREIETSKEFVSALKKAAEKHPKCLIKPVVTMQKKGEACAYKGVYLSLEDARASGKSITFIPGQDGKVYERRTTDVGEFITPAGQCSKNDQLDDIRPGFRSMLPRIPYALMQQALCLFRTMMYRGKGQSPMEALVHIYWDREEQKYFIHVPKQTVGPASVDAILDDEYLLDTDRYIHFADLHSHNRMPAAFSRTDDHDERPTGVYMVVGRLHRYFPEITVRISNGGHFLEIEPEQILEMPPDTSFPAEWLQQIHTVSEECFEVAA